MIRKPFAVAAAAMLAAMVGCAQTQPGSTRLLGRVDKDLAFTTAKDVMSQYFQVDPSGTDPLTGTIKCHPAAAQDRRERLLGASPTRQVASCQVFQSEDGQVLATVAVAVQQLGAGGFWAARNQGSYSGVPNETPAQAEAATTPEQNQTWKTIEHSYSTQQKILDDLYRRLHPEIEHRPPPPTPATGAAPAE